MLAHLFNITFTLNASMEDIRTRATTRRTVATHTLIIIIIFFFTWNVSMENDRWSLAIAAAKTSESKWR